MMNLTLVERVFVREKTEMYFAVLYYERDLYVETADHNPRKTDCS